MTMEIYQLTPKIAPADAGAPVILQAEARTLADALRQNPDCREATDAEITAYQTYWDAKYD